MWIYKSFSENMHQINPTEIVKMIDYGYPRERQDDIMTTPAKKMIPLCILNILRQHTDEEHTLDQKDIIELLEKEYNLVVERKAIRSNIVKLKEMGFPISYKETERESKDAGKEGNTIWSDFWLERDFTDPELRLIIDGLLFSNHIPHKQRMELVKKIEGLSSEYFKSHVRHIATLPDVGDSNKQIFNNIAILDEAIDKKRMVSFNYLDMEPDKKMYPKKDKQGKPVKYTVSPYQMAAKDGKYYLICNRDHYDAISNYRIDRLSNLVIQEDKKIRPYKELKGANGQDFNLGEYMKEHIYMYASEDTRVRFRCVRRMLTDVVDIFGKDVRIEEVTDEYLTASALVTEAAMLQFARNYAPDVVILEPQRLVDEMKDWAKKVKKAYGG